jgi:gliding-associated putative ABC transporter substrate-binding component GldG
MWAICKKEWTQYFNGLTGYLIIGFYLMVNGLFLFVLPNYNIFDFGYTSLQVYFDFAPWFLLLLVPAITMRSFSDEYKQGTYEILSTIPVSPLQLVFAKFLGSFLIVIIAILPTLLYAFALDNLSMVGGLDWGATIGAYFGLIFLAMVYTMVGVFASSTTKNSLISLLLSIVISIFLFKGFDWISAIAFSKNGFDYYVLQLGLAYHYQNVSKGAISLGDFMYFISIAILFGIGAMEQIKGAVKYLLLLFVLLVVNYAAAVITWQLDFTKDHRYTLSESSKQIIKQVETPVKVHLYLGGDLPANYKKLSQSAILLLSQLQKINAKHIQWELEVPNNVYKDEALESFYDSLSRLGVPIERIQAQDNASDKRVDQLMVPAAVIEVEGHKPMVIDLRAGKKYFKPYNVVKDIPTEDAEASANAAEALLEYKLVHAIYLLNRTDIPQIAYLTGNGQQIDLTVYDLGAIIKDQYRLATFDLKKGFPDATKIKTLIIVKPTMPFTELDKFKLDQYVMNGGNIIWAIDKLYASYDSLKNSTGSYVAFDRNLELDDILFKYGVRINANLLQDLNCAKLPIVIGNNADGSPKMERLPWPYYPFLYGNEHNLISQNIDRVLPIFPSGIDTLPSPEIKKTILLTTDTNSRIIATPNLIAINSVKDENDFLNFKQHHIPVAVLLEGKFSSLFANRLSAGLSDSIKNRGSSFVSKGLASSKQIVVADADLFTNATQKDREGNLQPLPMGMLPSDGYQFANRNFYLNAIAYLNDPDGLLESRNKVLVLRLLDREKLENARLFWQIILVLSPLFLLTLFYFIWNSFRKSKFAA